MKQSKIQFNGEELILKQSFRSLMLFEEMTGRSAYEVGVSVSDSMKLFYCMLKAANKDVYTQSFDAFLDTIDENPALLTEFNAFLTEDTKPATPGKKKVIKH